MSEENPSPLRAAKELITVLADSGTPAAEVAFLLEQLVETLKTHSVPEVRKVLALLEETGKTNDKGKALDAAVLAAKDSARRAPAGVPAAEPSSKG